MSTTTLLYRFVGLDAGAGAEFDRMGAKTAALGSTSSKALTAMRGLAIGAAAVGAVVGIESIKMAASFQTSMLRIHTQANASTKQVAVLSKGVLAMAGSVSTTPSVLADAAYHIASVGQGSLTAAAQLHVLKLAAEGAKVGGADLTDTTNALTATVVAGIRGAKDYSKAMGALNATVGAGDMKMQNLADALGTNVTITAKQAGVSLNQLGGALAVLGDNNVRGAKAGTQLRMSIQALEVPASTATSQFQTWHLATNAFAKDMQQGGLTKALADLRNHMIASGETGNKIGATLTQAFGKRAGGGIATLIGEYSRFQNKLKEVQQGAGGFGSSWAGYSKSFGAALDGAKASAESLMISLGTKLLPTATRVMNWIRTTGIPALISLGHWMRQNKTAIEAVGIALAAMFFPMVTLGVGLVVLYKRSQTFRNIVSGAIHAVGVAFNWLRDEGGKALGWLKAQFAVFSAFWRSHSQQIRQVTHEAWVAISTIVKTTWKAAMAVLLPALKLTLTAFKVTFRLIGDVLSTFVKTALDFVGLILDILTGKWGKAWDDAKKLVTDTFKGIGKILSDFAKGALTLLVQAGKDIIQGLINGIGSMLGALKSKVSSIAGDVKHAFTHPLSILSPSKVFHKYGLNIVQGLINGIKEYSVKARDVMRTLAAGIISGWKNGTAPLKDALSTPVQAALARLQRVVDNAIAKQQASLTKAQDKLHQLTKARKSAISSLAGSIAGQVDMSSVFGLTKTVTSTTNDFTGSSDVQGTVSKTVTYNKSVSAYLAGQARQIERFAKDLKWARRHHLSPVLLEQIANMGAEQGEKVLRQFMSGQSSITQANTAESTIQKYSTGAARGIEDKIYASRVAKDRAAVHENSKALHDLTKALHRVEMSTAHHAAMDLTINAKTGKPQVDKHFIDEIIKGIKKAERVAQRKLL